MLLPLCRCPMLSLPRLLPKTAEAEETDTNNPATNDKPPTHPLPPMTSAPVVSARVACCRATLTLLLAAARAAAEDSMVPVRRFVMSKLAD